MASINVGKTETMCIGPECDFFIDGKVLQNVKRFKYLESIVTRDCSIKEELIGRIQAVSSAYGRLRNRVFDSHDLTPSTKIKIYVQCLIPLLTYDSETWTLYRHNINQLRTVQQRHLTKILKIRWSDYVSNEEVLRRANVEDIEIILTRSRLRWLGHASRMENGRPVKALLYGELDKGIRPVGRPNLRYKDTCKSALKSGGILDEWQQMVYDKALWTAITEHLCKRMNENRVKKYVQRKEQRARCLHGEVNILV